MNQKIAFITGGNRGIGFETARQLGKQGVLVVLGAREESSGRKAKLTLQDEGIATDFLVFDINSTSDHSIAYEHFSTQYGRLDILINNAGTHLEGEPGVEQRYTASTVPLEVWRETFDTNFFGLVGITQRLLPLLRQSPAGRIVNLSSILGSLSLHANPASPIYAMKNAAYDTSKTAINSFTIQLAYELRNEPIKVNSAHPGWVQTEMGGSAAPMSIVEGAKTSVILATLTADGPSGGFFHGTDALPW